MNTSHFCQSISRAHSDFIMAFDHVSSISDHQRAILCQLATGLGYFSKGQGAFIRRPVIFNGIPFTLMDEELVQCCWLIQLDLPLNYESETTLEKRFVEKHPRALGALLSKICDMRRSSRAPEMFRILD
jgi:hypothetical protein